MLNTGRSIDNTHLGDTKILGDLEVTQDLLIDGAFEVVGDLVIDAPNCLKSDCIKPVTTNGNVDIQNSSGNTIAELYDDQSVGAFKIFGFGGLNLSSNNTDNAVAVLDAGLGVNTAGLRLPSTKLNVDEIQSQSHEVTGDNPKILFTASKIEVTGDNPIDFQTKSILTTEIKKDSSGGNLIIKSSDNTQVLKVDDNLKELFVGEDADGWRAPKLRGAIGTLLTMSNTGVATYEEPVQTGSTQVTGTIVTPRILYSAGVFENIASSYAGTTVIQPNTWSIGDVFTVNIRGEWTAISANTRTAFFRLDLGQSLLSQVSDDVSPGSLSASSSNPFELFVGLTRISTTEINWVANGWRRDTNNVTRIIKFGDGKVSSYDESLAMDVSILFQDNSTSGAGDPTIYFECMSGIWAQSTTASVIPVITTSDHTALSNLQLGDAGHNQFALLNGRNGGQILSGSNLTAEGLTIRSNSVDPSTASINMTSDLNMSSKDVSAVGALSCVSATLDEFLTIGDGKTSSELKFKGSTSGLNRIYVEPNQGIALNILTDTFVSLMAFNSQVGSEAVGILKPLDMVGNIVENVIQLDTGAYGDMTVKRNGVDKIVVGDTETSFVGDVTIGGDLAGINSIKANGVNDIIQLKDSTGTPYMSLGDGATNDYNTSFKDFLMYPGGKFIGSPSASGNLNLSSTIDLVKGSIVCEDAVICEGSLTVGSRATLADGTIALPSLTFTNDLTTGLSRDTGNDGVVLSVTGSERLSFGGLTIPAQMSSDILPSPQVASASSFLINDLKPWRAFDRDPIQYWHGADGRYNTTTGVYTGSDLINIDGTDRKGDWLKLDMGVIKTVSSYRILGRVGHATTRAPNTFYIAYSDDNVLWSQADYKTGESFAEGVYNDYTLAAPVRGRYFVIVSLIIGNDGKTNSRSTINIAELEYSFESDAVISANSLLPRGDASCDLGSTTKQFKNLYTTGANVGGDLDVVGNASIGGRLTQFADLLAVPSPVMSGLFTQTADRLISNIGAPPGLFTLFGTGIGSRTVPPNTFIVGSSFFTKICGIFPDNGNQNYDLDVQINNVSVFAVSPINFAGNFPTNSQWDIELEFVVRTVGVTGSIIFNGLITTIDSGSLIATSLTTENPFVLNTTIANTLDVKVNPQTNGTAIKSQTARISKVY